MKLFILIVVILLSLNIMSQKSDTLHIPMIYKEFEKQYVTISLFWERKGTEEFIYKVNDKIVTESVYMHYIEYQDAIENYFPGKHVIFYFENGNKDVEGTWTFEFSIGDYVEYRKDGSRRKSGKYDENGRGIGIWYFYNRKGKIKREYVCDKK